ncbi:MAG: hypothetical protein MJ051_04075 [Akkermansia sp.]|nr:hypothetical protein [Akkermansia sp.]
MQEIPHLLGFTSGELTPWLDTRFDLQAYRRGAASIRNFIVQPYGGVERRHGTAFVAMAGSQEADAVRLFDFTYSETDALLLEFFPGGMRVYRDGVLLTVPRDGSAVPYVLDVPWQSAEQVRSLRFTQVNDAVYVTCPTHLPVVLYRSTDTQWSWEVPDFSPFPRATYAPRSATLTVSGEAYSDEVLLELSEDSEEIFTPDMAGHEWVMADVKAEEKTLLENNSNYSTNIPVLPPLGQATLRPGTYYYRVSAQTNMLQFWTVLREYTPADYRGVDDPAMYPQFLMPGIPLLYQWVNPFEICRDWELRTQGTWNAKWEIRRSYDKWKPSILFDGEGENARHPYRWDWTCIKTFEQNGYSERRNWALSGSESQPCRLMLVCRESDTAAFGSYVVFRRFSGERECKYRITEVLGARKAKAECLSYYSDLPRYFSTQKWSFGAFGVYNGYPTFSSYSSDRLWFGGMRKSPTTLVGSVTDDFHNFRVSSEDDSAMHLTIASDNQSRICWVVPSRQMLVGTSEGVWTLGGGDGGPLSPSNANFRLQTAVGCENMPPLSVEGCVLFPQRGGKRLREISYKLEADGFSATDVSLMAEHLFRAGVREYAVQEGSGSYIWTVMNDGSAAVLTLHPEQQVMAWQRVCFEGRRVLHVVTLPHPGAERDDVWMVLRHEGNGTVTVERLTEANPYLDACTELQTDETGRATGLDYLAGQKVMLLQNGHEVCTATVGADGALQAPSAGRYLAGLPFRSELQTMPMESEMSFNSVREFSRVRLRLYESGLQFAYKAAHASRWEYMDPAVLHLEAPYTGSLRLDQMPDAGVGQGFCLRCEGLADFRLLAMSIEVDHHGK